nr:MAG TPA: hypothetical protein [Caudoviricetes sp.]
MKEFYKIDLEMLAKAKDVMEFLQNDADLEVSKRNEFQFMMRYFEGLQQRIQNNIAAGQQGVLSSSI